MRLWVSRELGESVPVGAVLRNPTEELHVERS